MITNDLDAELASLMSMDETSQALMNDFNSALEIVNEINTFGITQESYLKLKALAPDLSVPEIELSSMPIRMGAEEIGNEALASLGTAATVALITALAALFAWIVSKLFGDSSSGGGFGGGSYVVAAAKANLPFPTKALIQSVKEESALNGSKLTEKEADKIRVINATATALEMLNNGKYSSIISTIEMLTGDLKDLVGETIDKEVVVKVCGNTVQTDFAKLINDYPLLSDGNKRRLIWAKTSDIAALGQSVAKARADSKDVGTMYNQYKETGPDTVDLNAGQINKVKSSADSLAKKLKAMGEDLSDKKVVDTSTRDIVNNTLKVISKFASAVMTGDLSKLQDEANNTYQGITKLCTANVEFYRGLAKPQKAIVEKECGLDEPAISNLGPRVAKMDLKAIHELTALATAMEKKVELTKEQKAKLGTTVLNALN